jgi:hypothetical protein
MGILQALFDRTVSLTQLEPTPPPSSTHLFANLQVAGDFAMPFALTCFQNNLGAQDNLL